MFIILEIILILMENRQKTFKILNFHIYISGLLEVTNKYNTSFDMDLNNKVLQKILNIVKQKKLN